MTWIKVIAEAEATGELKELYDSQRGQAGAVANILKVHSLSPRTLAAHVAFYRQVMHTPGPLPREKREMIAVVVSQINGCHY